MGGWGGLIPTRDCFVRHTADISPLYPKFEIAGDLYRILVVIDLQIHQQSVRAASPADARLCYCGRLQTGLSQQDPAPPPPQQDPGNPSHCCPSQ